MKTETTRLHHEFDEVVQRCNALAARLDDEALMRRPAPASWSVAENLEHLSATAATYNRRIRRRLDASTTSDTFSREKKSVVGRLWLSLVEPPPRMRLKVPAAALQPGEITTRDALLARFGETHATLIALLEESDAYDRMRLRIPTAFAKRITVTLYDGFVVLAAHGRRHLWQAEKAVGSLQ
ncbi:MAG TPA: DinB family protein [Thermoanaerobaculia bacterium]|nr:DinB family protein [Thermoanaerobaculia bacterium]